MTVQYFVHSQSLQGIALVEIDGQPVIDRHKLLISVIQERCGREVASLFAEPRLTRGNGVSESRIDWYCSFDGVVRPLNELDPGSAAAVRRAVGDRARAIYSLVSDPALGPFFAAAFNIPSSDAIMSVGGEPVIVSWGTLPLGALQDQEIRRQLYSTGLQTYLPGLPPPPVSRQEWRQSHPDTEPNAAPILGVREALPVRRSSWAAIRAPATACAVAAAATGLLLIPGVLRYPDQQTNPSSSREITQAVLSTLQKKSADLKALLSRNCEEIRAGLGNLVPPSPRDVQVAPSTFPSPVASPGSAAAAPPPPDARTTPPLITTPPPASPTDLPSRAARGVALVMRGNSQGTGFFISPDTVVTNRHVIHGEKGTVYIASKFVGVTPARVLAESGTGDFDDFALLRVAPQANVLPFTLTSNTPQLQPVVASGFPGLHQATNPAFERMREGDRSALEDVTPTDTRGEINATQRQNASMTLIIHSAVISPGNSGGPLLDFCGRVAGVNTFVRVDERMPVSAFYALSSSGLQKFLASTGLAMQVDESACAATVAAPPVPQPAAPPPGEQQGAARARDARTPSTSDKR